MSLSGAAMIAVWFRFYGPLNDFVAPLRRQQTFRHRLAGPSSVKDAIEAVGVPHPEVDLIVVDGAAAGFEYRVQDGDRVSVYPVFRRIDLTGAGRVGVAPATPIRFVIDVHLGKLCSLLRLAGLDTVIEDQDDIAAGRSARERRVLLTRDVGLLKRSIVECGYWVRQTDPPRQFVEVLERYGLADAMAPFTRCLRCNTLLAAADLAQVAARLQPRTRETFREFHECPGCGRVYWRGAHYERLVVALERARAAAGGIRRGSS